MEPPFPSLGEALAARAAAHPDAPAVADGSRALTYAELDRRANGIAAAIAGCGVAPGSLVGVAVQRSAAVVEAICGVLAAGCAYVPLDPGYPEERLAFMVEDAGIEVVVGDGSAPLPASAHRLDVAAAAEGAPAGRRAGDDAALAYVIYTSGSTGRPKGVCVSHRNVLSLVTAAARCFRFGPADVWSLFHSCSFDVSVFELWGALLTGGRVAVVPDEATVDPAQLVALLARERVTVLGQVPSVFKYLVWEAELSGLPPIALRYVIFAGEPLDVATVRRFLDLRPEPRPEIVNMYGITETTVHATRKTIRERDLRPGPTPIGRPLPHLEILLVDDDLTEVPDGEVGEILVGGAGVARGYLGRPELTAERFVTLPRSSGRWYRSGDLARRRPDGELEFHGRADAQLKLRGYRIEPGEIEETARRLPGVADAVAVVADPGETGEPVLVLYCRPESHGRVDGSAVRAALARALPHYLVPAAIVAVERFPLTPSGKTDRRALAADFRA
jgi:amino acid adenylation domain-containing protein